MTVILRAATGADIDVIADIETLVFSDPWSPASFAGLLGGPRTRLIVAEEGGHVIGYSVLLLAPPDADLANLAVAPGSRGRGIGRQMLEDVVHAARDGGVQHVYLEVRESNARAIAMYEHAGFVAFGLRRRYYREPVEDAKVMRLDLSHD